MGPLESRVRHNLAFANRKTLCTTVYVSDQHELHSTASIYRQEEQRRRLSSRLSYYKYPGRPGISIQRASWSHHCFSLRVHRDHAEVITGFKGTAPEGNTEAAFQSGIAKSQSGRNSWRDCSGFLKPQTHFDFSRTCTATPSMQLQIGPDDRVA